MIDESVNINGGLAIATDSNGLPVIAFINNTALNLFECTSSDCSSGTRYEIHAFDAANSFSPDGQISIALTSDDTRLIAYTGHQIAASGKWMFLAIVGAS
jgi:hypothetical protein